MTFTEYLQKDVGTYSIKDILNNLTVEQIKEAIDDYSKDNGLIFTNEEQRAFVGIIDDGWFK
jgi:hypothetical protein